MFGIFYLLGTTIASIFSGTKAAHENYECIKRGNERKAKGENTANIYYDRLGSTRDLTTHNIVNVDHISCERRGEDACIRDIYGNVIRNLSEEKRNERWNEFKHNPDGSTVCFWKPHSVNNEVWGTQFKDLETGRIFVERDLKYFNSRDVGEKSGIFYMDCETGLLVRETDFYKGIISKKKLSRKAIQKFIEEFNESQKANRKFYWNTCMFR